MHSRRALALTALILLMVMWGSTFVITKAAAREFSPLMLAMLRFAIASLVLVPVALLRNGFARLPRPPPWKSLLWMSLAGIAGFSATFTLALVYGSASQGALIYAALPAAIAGAAMVFLGERPSKRQLAGIALSIAGVLLLIAAGKADTDSPAPLAGALWMLGAVVAWTIYTVIAKQYAQANSITVIAWVSVMGTAMLVPFAAIEFAQRPWTMPSAQAWGSLLFLGVVASALAYLVYGWVLRELEASLVGLYTNLDPIVGVLIAVALYGESLQTGQIVGGLLALVGMWLASIQRDD